MSASLVSVEGQYVFCYRLKVSSYYLI